jgi:hypothetical protein
MIAQLSQNHILVLQQGVITLFDVHGNQTILFQRRSDGFMHSASHQLPAGLYSSYFLEKTFIVRVLKIHIRRMNQIYLSIFQYS